MLLLSENAAVAVRRIVEATADLSDETAGLRLFGRRESAGEIRLDLALAQLPAEDDEVVETEGARVFIDPGIAAHLADKVLDAELGAREVRFSVNAQG